MRTLKLFCKNVYQQVSVLLSDWTVKQDEMITLDFSLSFVQTGGSDEMLPTSSKQHDK